LVALMRAQDVPRHLPTLPPVDVVSYRGALVRDWLAAVLDHTPGKEDQALRVVRRWGAEELRDAWVSVNVMVALLEDPNRRRFSVPQKGSLIPVEVTSPDLHYMALNAKKLLQRPGRNRFLKRAALLHSDAAVLAGPRPRWPFNSSFLLPERVFVLTADGKQESLYGGDVNWEFGRMLLEGVANAGQDADVWQWYGASLAHMLAAEHYDNPHFEHALELLPRTADILFRNGCLHESLAERRVQTAIDGVKIPARTSLDVKSERQELNKAESLFRGALEANPQHYEARLRRGRTLGRLGQHQAAASELSATLGARDPLLQYYASLFLGAEEEALGRFDAARTMYEQAVALYPKAQAPRLALSQLAHRSGDRAAARAALQPVLRSGERPAEDDPWWTYPMSCGRDADEYWSDVYRSVTGRQ